MGKQQKRNNSRKFKSITKVRKPKKKPEVVNKKALYNRYKNKQQIEQELEKKRRFEHQLLQKQQKQVSESEEEVEDDTFNQLVSGFKSGNSVRTKVVESDSDLESEDGSNNGHVSGSDQELVEYDSDLSDVAEPISEDEVDKASESSEEGEDVDNLDEEMPDHHNEDDETDLKEDDPFTKHLEYDLSSDLLVTLTSTQPTMEQAKKTWPTLGQLVITIPQPITSTTTKKAKQTVSILEEKTYAPIAKIPHSLLTVNFDDLHIKTQIRNNIASANIKNLVKRDLDLTDVFTPLQKELFSIINNYQDLYCPLRNYSNADEIRFTYCLHAVNHMMKTRTKILHHNAKLSKKVDSNEEYRDQGLVRPKVIIMVPFKDSAYRIVKTLIDILVPKESGQVINKKRFEDEFTGGEIAMPKKNPKPEDYELLFSGNTEDTFRLGMTITKKTLKLYTEFYSSDIIVTSPLGLRMIVGAEGEEERDYDFLSSIELLIMDQADVFLMQNWDHVLHVLDHFHLQPKKTHGTDFSRVRSWAVNGWSKYYRQTLVFSAIALPEIRALVNKKCHNYAGTVLVLNPVETGSIRQIILQVPQIFHRINASSPLQALESRFDYFIKEVLPKQRDPLMGHTLIYVPSYFDFVRLRNHLKKEDIGFVQICEYSKEGKIARARDMFFHSEAHFLLYSERAHFFRRLRLKGARHIVFYQPPTYPHFYSEMCNLMQECNQNKYGGSECNMSVTVLFSKYDAQQLSAILGTERAAAMLRAEKHVHMYVTGD